MTFYLICLIFLTYINYIQLPTIFIKLFLLNMQVFFYYLTDIFMSQINHKFGFEQVNNLNSNYLNENPLNDDIYFIKKDENPDSDSILDQYDYTGLMEFFMEFIFVYKWFMLPFVLFIALLHISHGLFGLYSAYVDYFQKNPDHIDSYRAFIPVFSISLFFVFVFFGLFFFTFSLYLKYIIWFLFI
jgi:hypothetical protein